MDHFTPLPSAPRRVMSCLMLDHSLTLQESLLCWYGRSFRSSLLREAEGHVIFNAWAWLFKIWNQFSILARKTASLNTRPLHGGSCHNRSLSMTFQNLEQIFLYWHGRSFRSSLLRFAEGHVIIDPWSWLSNVGRKFSILARNIASLHFSRLRSAEGHVMFNAWSSLFNFQKKSFLYWQGISLRSTPLRCAEGHVIIDPWAWLFNFQKKFSMLAW